MWSLITDSKGWLAFATLLGTIREVIAAVTPVVLGIALDQGFEHGATRGVWIAALWLLLLAFVESLVAGVGHGADVALWIKTAGRTMTRVHTHVTRVGPAVLREKSTGEVVATMMSDTFHVANFVETFPRLFGSALAFVVVAFVLLGQNVTLGLVVLIGVPLITAGAALLIKPLQNLQAAQREEQGKLTSLGTDTVAGLRVLRGIGGESQFNARYAEQSQRVRTTGNAVARLQSWIDGLQILIPGMFTALVMWLGAQLAMSGDITIGQFTALFGLTAYLARPLRMVMMSVSQFGRARVGARKIFNVLRIEPVAGNMDERAAVTHREESGKPELIEAEYDQLFDGSLVDNATGIEIKPGLFTAVVSSKPESTARLAERLARMDDKTADVTLSGIDIRKIPVDTVRRHILLSQATPELFGGTLRSVTDAQHPYPTTDVALAEAHAAAGKKMKLPTPPLFSIEADPERDARILGALEDADGHDVLSSLGYTLDGEIMERARSLSGGQRQRVALARALLADPTVLIAVEPTSAVDSHTEDRIADRLRDRRAGKTTVIMSASPLLLDRVDEVILLTDGKEVVRGLHRDLLDRADAGDPAATAYAKVISRQTAEKEDAS